MGNRIAYLDPAVGFNSLLQVTSDVNAKKCSLAKAIFVKKPQQFGLALAAVVVGIGALVRQIFVLIAGIFPLLFKAILFVVRDLSHSSATDKIYQKLPGLRDAVEQIKKVVAQILGVLISLLSSVLVAYHGSEWNVRAQVAMGTCSKPKTVKNSTPKVEPPKKGTTTKPSKSVVLKKRRSIV